MASNCFIGVDVAQRSLSVAVAGQSTALEIPNTASGIRAWLRTVPAGCYIGMESTGGFHRTLALLAIGAGHTAYVLNPRDLSHYARALGRRAKTDRLDAALIARYLEHERKDLHPYRLPSELQAQLDDLFGRRHKVVVAQTALRQSFATVKTKPRQLAPSLRALAVLIEEIDTRIEALIARDAALQQTAQRLRTAVGIGPLVGPYLAHILRRFNFRNADAFIAYIGFDPRVRDSGTMRGRRYLTKRGPAELRRLLYIAAMSAARSALWRPIYERYCARGLAAKTIYVILARKLARIAFSMVRYGNDFNPETPKNACAKP